MDLSQDRSGEEPLQFIEAIEVILDFRACEYALQVRSAFLAFRHSIRRISNVRLGAQFIYVCFRASAYNQANRFNYRLVSIAFNFRCPIVIGSIARFCLFVERIYRSFTSNFQYIRIGQDVLCHRRFPYHRRNTICQDGAIKDCMRRIVYD